MDDSKEKECQRIEVENTKVKKSVDMGKRENGTCLV